MIGFYRLEWKCRTHEPKPNRYENGYDEDSGGEIQKEFGVHKQEIFMLRY